MNILTVSLSKTFSDTRVMKYINWYLDNSYNVTAIGLDEEYKSNLKANKNFAYMQLKKMTEQKTIINNRLKKFFKINFYISILIVFISFLLFDFEIFQESIKNIYFNLSKDFNLLKDTLKYYLYSNNIVYFVIVFILISILNLVFILLKNKKNITNFISFIIRFRKFLKTFQELIDVDKKKFYKIIHLHDIWTLIFLNKIKKKYPDSKIILDLHELYEEVPRQTIEYKIRCKIFIIFLKLYKKKIDHFITINDDIKKYYETKHKLNPILLISNSCNIINEDILDGTDITYQTLIRLKKENKKILLYHGGLSAYRGIIEVCNFFKNNNPKNWIFIIIGDGKLENLIDDIIKNNLHENIYKFDAVKLNILSIYTKKADLGLINYENNCLNHNYCNPNKLWEYTSCGVPLLLSNCKSFIDLNNQYNFAKIIFDKNKLDESLSKYLNELNDDEKLKELSNNAVKFYDKNNFIIEKNKFNNFLLDFVR